MGMVAAQHRPRYGVRLYGIELGHELWKKGTAAIVEQRPPSFLTSFGMNNAHTVGPLLRAVVGRIESPE